MSWFKPKPTPKSELEFARAEVHDGDYVHPETLERWIRAIVADELEKRKPGDIRTAAGLTLDAICGIITRPAGMTDEDVRRLYGGKQ